VLAGLALIKRVERINMIVVYLQQQQAEFIPRHNPYVMEVDHERNYYSCGGFCHITRNYRNQRIVR